MPVWLIHKELTIILLPSYIGDLRQNIPHSLIKSNATITGQLTVIFSVWFKNPKPYTISLLCQL